MFAPDEMGDFDEMLSGYLDGTLAGHSWIVLEDESPEVVGAAYYAPEPFADRMWNLYFIAVQPGGHRSGAGHALISHVEDALRAQGDEVARVLTRPRSVASKRYAIQPVAHRRRLCRAAPGRMYGQRRPRRCRGSVAGSILATAAERRRLRAR